MSAELDKQHIERVLAGDTEAFRYFIDEYQGLATKIAYSMVSDEEQVRLIVHNAFVQAFRSLASFRMEARFSTWLYRIVVNESIKANRKSKLEQKTVALTAHDVAKKVTLNEAVGTIESAEQNARINAALARMKPKERLMLQLFYLQEKSIAEIEKITGFSTSNVKVLLHRARKNFARCFTPEN